MPNTVECEGEKIYKFTSSELFILIFQNSLIMKWQFVFLLINFPAILAAFSVLIIWNRFCMKTFKD